MNRDTHPSHEQLPAVTTDPSGTQLRRTGRQGIFSLNIHIQKVMFLINSVHIFYQTKDEAVMHKFALV